MMRWIAVVMALLWPVVSHGQTVADSVSGEVADVNARLEAFAKQRGTGKGLMLAGSMLAVGGSMVNTDDVAPVNPVVLLGGALAVVGYVIDLVAGKKLKQKQDNKRGVEMGPATPQTDRGGG